MSSSHYRPPILFAGRDLDEPITFSIRDGEVALFTHSSPTRGDDNEDAVGVFEWEDETGVLVVADGLGGLPQGSNASQLLVNSFSDPTITETTDPVVARLKAANELLVSGQSGGGTTASVVTIDCRRIRSYHVGDSTIMVVGRRGRIKFRTTPHSPVGIAEATGQIDEEAAMIHPNRHVINNMVGMPDMWVEVGRPIQLSDLDTVILASDGLWDNLYVKEVVTLMCRPSLFEAAKGLSRIIDDRMKCSLNAKLSKPDDLTLVLYRLKEEANY